MPENGALQNHTKRLKKLNEGFGMSKIKKDLITKMLCGVFGKQCRKKAL